jgi:hypothetical protein
VTRTVLSRITVKFAPPTGISSYCRVLDVQDAIIESRREQLARVWAGEIDLGEVQERPAAVTTCGSEEGRVQKQKRLEKEACGPTKKHKAAPRQSLAETRRLNRARAAAEALEEMAALQAGQLARGKARADRLQERQRQAS